MQLWTWQKEDFSLTNPEESVDGRTHSDYYKDHKEEFEELWDRLGTSQFLWCFAEEEEALSKASRLEYEGSVLWELDVPTACIFHTVCSVAWHWILQGCRCHPPSQLRRLWRRDAPNKAREIEEKFHLFWANKNREELWAALFSLDGIVTPCSAPLVHYPLEEKWVKSNTPWAEVKFTA